MHQVISLEEGKFMQSSCPFNVLLMYFISHCPLGTQTPFVLFTIVGVPQVCVLGPIKFLGNTLTQAQTCTPTNTKSCRQKSLMEENVRECLVEQNQ